MLAILKRVGLNVVRMFLGKTMILWGLRLAVKQTDTKIDDNVVEVVAAGYDNDPERFKKAAEALIEAVRQENR